jgi:hypothetical protein
MASPPTEGGLIGLASIALFLQSSDKIFTAHSSNCGISFACTNRITARASSSARAKRIGERVRLLQSPKIRFRNDVMKSAEDRQKIGRRVDDQDGEEVTRRPRARHRERNRRRSVFVAAPPWKLGCRASASSSRPSAATLRSASAPLRRSTYVAQGRARCFHTINPCEWWAGNSNRAPALAVSVSRCSVPPSASGCPVPASSQGVSVVRDFETGGILI